MRHLISIRQTVFALLMLTSGIDTALADNRLTFGSFGSTGSQGDAGRDGIRGRDLLARADGLSHDFDLSGTDGSAGSYGYDGGDAHSCYQPDRPHRNVRAASGGDGGNGGAGGNGGDAGNLVLLFDDWEDVRKVRVVARGGVGGDGGPGGRGGRACYCSYGSWTHEECKNERVADGSKQRVCRNVVKKCRDGREGQYGGRGEHGDDGRHGAVYFVQGVKDWQEDMTSMQVPLTETDNASFTLTEHIFSTHAGAAERLALGSYVDDTFYEYSGTEKATLSMNWKSDRSPRALHGLELHLTKTGSDIEYRIPGALVLYEENDGPDLTVTVKHLVTEGEARSPEISVVSDGPDSAIVIDDRLGVNDKLTDSIHLTVSSKRLFGWKKRIERAIDDHEYTKVDGLFRIPLKNLGIKHKFLKTGKKFKIKVSLQRTLGNDAVTIDYEDKVTL